MINAVLFDVGETIVNETREHGTWADWLRAVWLGTAAALVTPSFGVGNLSIGMPHAESFTNEVGSVTGQRMIETHDPRGAVAPAEILAAPGPADQVVAAARTVSGVAEVGEPERSPDGRWVRIAAVLAHTPDSAQRWTPSIW